jgi:predicted RND superfamily exporter protein
MSGDFFKAFFERVKFNLFVLAICLTSVVIYVKCHIAIAGVIALCLAIYLVLLSMNYCWEKYQHKISERKRDRANAEYHKQKEDSDNMMIDIWFEAARPMLKEQLIALMNFRSKYDAPNIKFSDGKSLYLNDSECYILKFRI